jgi:hypothetical protein
VCVDPWNCYSYLRLQVISVPQIQLTIQTLSPVTNTWYTGVRSGIEFD